jgi:hypothetical protein
MIPIRRQGFVGPPDRSRNMLRWMVGATVLAASLAANAANDGPVELRTKALASAASTSVLAGPMAGTSHRLDAPFMPVPHDPLPVMEEEQAPRVVAVNRCDGNAHSLCFDAADGRIVYRGARNYMPKMDGLSPESVSVRRNTLVFKYSFK